MTLGRTASAAFPVPLHFTGAKGAYHRRFVLDKDVCLLFQLLQCPQFSAIGARVMSALFVHVPHFPLPSLFPTLYDSLLF